MPVGAYEPRWFMKPVHLDPDEALEAFAGLTRAHSTHTTIMVAMHWGTFTLTDEPMDEPTRRTEAGWTNRGWPADRLWILNPGETRAVSSAR
jgi:L-ascorbate metabolism protein UlaG (beta-lactamase superfamily)